jgi:hypothetical protein
MSRGSMQDLMTPLFGSKGYRNSITHDPCSGPTSRVLDLTATAQRGGLFNF